MFSTYNTKNKKIVIYNSHLTYLYITYWVNRLPTERVLPYYHIKIENKL